MSPALPLRIAQLAPVAGPVRPGDGDSVEQLVSLLTEGLIERGHEVTLYATGDSQTSAQLRAVQPRGYDVEERLWDWYRSESFHAASAFEHSADHDLIHAHDFHFALPFSRLAPTPLVETAHVEIAPEVLTELARRPEVHVVTVSEHARARLGTRGNVSVIPHGVDFDAFPFGARAEGYLLFLGRMIADKGPADAVRIAHTAGLPLIMAGPEQDGYDPRAEIDLGIGEVEWVGRVGPQERNRLLAGAVALLFPNVYPEPFGLVLIEAMACGTPALATTLGASAEIIDSGITGYTALSWEELARRIPDAAALDRARVRARARARFSKERMIESHVQLYRSLARRER